jgi:hypothetical protein
MKRRHRKPIHGFNTVEPTSGYAARFDMHKSGDWSAVTVIGGLHTVLGCGNTLKQCRESIGDGIRGTVEWLRINGKPILEPESREVPLSN